MKPRLPLVMDLNLFGQIAQLNEQKRLREELEKQNEIARRAARVSQTASQPASIPHATDKAGPCCACNKIVSFEALTCPHCGQPNAGQQARGIAQQRANDVAKIPFERAWEPGSKNIVCPKCGRNFNRYKKFRTHSRREHNVILEENPDTRGF